MRVPPDAAPAVASMCERLAAEFPRFRLVAKERSAFMRVLFVACTMPVSSPSFLRGVTTTIGYAVYMPSASRTNPVSGVLVLRAERDRLLAEAA